MCPECGINNVSFDDLYFAGMCNDCILGKKAGEARPASKGKSALRTRIPRLSTCLPGCVCLKV